jgi:hypothetical protein
MIQALQKPIKETLLPAPDGIAIDFFTSKTYKLNSVSLWINGIKLIRDWDDGFEELGGNMIRMKEAPLEFDSVQAEYEAL